MTCLRWRFSWEKRLGKSIQGGMWAKLDTCPHVSYEIYNILHRQPFKTFLYPVKWVVNVVFVLVSWNPYHNNKKSDVFDLSVYSLRTINRNGYLNSDVFQVISLFILLLFYTFEQKQERIRVVGIRLRLVTYHMKMLNEPDCRFITYFRWRWSKNGSKFIFITDINTPMYVYAMVSYLIEIR